MKNEKLIELANIDKMRITETYGNVTISIDVGGYCIFNKHVPRNYLHKHSFYEICFVLSGKGEFYHGGITYAIKPGDIFVADPEIMHEIKLIAKDNEYAENLHLVYISIEIIKNALPPIESFEEKLIASFLKHHEIVCGAKYYMSSYFGLIESFGLFNTGINYGLVQAVKSFALECLISLNKKEYPERKTILNPHSESILNLALKYIHNNTDKKILITDIAKNSFTTTRNLQHIFRKHLDTSIVEYINTRKMNYASNYLKMNFRVSEVAALVGINDPAQFCRLFKKYYKVSPSKFRVM